MSIENLKIAKSALTDEIYAGYLQKSKLGFPVWRKKKNVTNDFLQAVIDRWNGYEETISGGGKQYVISVREVQIPVGSEVIT